MRPGEIFIPRALRTPRPPRSRRRQEEAGGPEGHLTLDCPASLPPGLLRSEIVFSEIRDKKLKHMKA